MEELETSAPLSADNLLMIMDLEFASARLDSLKLMENAFPENPAEPTKSELLMEVANVFKDSPTTMESALNVLPELSGALPQENASSFAVRTQLMMSKPRSACALKDSVSWVEFVKPAPQTTSSAMDTASLAQSTPDSTQHQETAIASAVSTPINSESALRNATPTKNTILTLINVNASRVSEEFKEDAQSVLLDQKPLPMDPAALTAKSMKFFSVENASANKDMPTTQQEFAQPVKISPTDSSLTASAQFAPKA